MDYLKKNILIRSYELLYLVRNLFYLTSLNLFYLTSKFLFTLKFKVKWDGQDANGCPFANTWEPEDLIGDCFNDRIDELRAGLTETQLERNPRLSKRFFNEVAYFFTDEPTRARNEK